VDFSDGNFIIVFQFVEGITLRKIIETEGPCDLAAARTWFQQIASALDHAHAKEVVHRDIKPENIIVTPDRTAAYLVDFGIALSAQEASKLTESGFVIGTPGYMSPEQQQGEDLDWRTDMYSLAVTLYEALAAKQIPVGEYQALSISNEAIPPEIDNLIQDCLSAKEQRLETPKSFSSRLGAALRPTRPLSEVLAHGRLHELGAAISELTPESFIKLPIGQRELILAKLSDLVQSGDQNLEFAVEQLLELMLFRGLLLDAEQYREIVVPSLDWAFTKRFNGFIGRPSLRRGLEAAAYDSRGPAHEVLCQELVKFLDETDLVDEDDWFLHSVRLILQALLANPACEKYAGELAGALRRLNATHRSRTSVSKPTSSW